MKITRCQRCIVKDYKDDIWWQHQLQWHESVNQEDRWQGGFECLVHGVSKRVGQTGVNWRTNGLRPAVSNFLWTLLSIWKWLKIRTSNSGLVRWRKSQSWEVYVVQEDQKMLGHNDCKSAFQCPRLWGLKVNDYLRYPESEVYLSVNQTVCYNGPTGDIASFESVFLCSNQILDFVVAWGFSRFKFCNVQLRSMSFLLFLANSSCLSSWRILYCINLWSKMYC